MEHIQPKGLPEYTALEGRWENFLLACVNCNSTKKTKVLNPCDVLLPDRDNTFAAFEYYPNGTVMPHVALTACQQAMARKCLALVGIDKKISAIHDENGKLIAIDRVAQRMEAWLKALDAKTDVDTHPTSDVLRHRVVCQALAEGFFSIWMTVFATDTDMRTRLIDAFRGTRDSGCFHQDTTMPVSPAPNLDALPDGGKV